MLTDPSREKTAVEITKFLTHKHYCENNFLAGEDLLDDPFLWFGAGEDAADDALEGAWARAFRRFCADELGYQGPARYLTNNYDKVNAGWNWGHEEPGLGEVATPNVSLDIAVALRRNPTCKLAIIGGRYDAATTWWNVVHDMSCQFLSPELKSRVSWYRYGCGHMAYVDEPTLEAMGRDVHEFYEKR